MFQNITKEFQGVFRTLRGRGKLSEKNIEDAIRKIRVSLLAADVNTRVVKEFIQEIKGKVLGSRVLGSLTPDQQFIKIVNEELVALMGSATELDFACRPPVVIMCVGLQGSGKTTTVAKLARHITAKGKRCYLVPADLVRPAAVKQLTVLGRSLNIDVHPSEAGSDPVSVAKQALAHATKFGYDVVLVDTAGRLHVDEVLMDEVQKVAKAINAYHTLFVADAMTGQDAVKSAKAFADALPLTGIILTKLDGDARGGAALSIRKVTNKPILFVGVGEKIEALEPFMPDRMASRILGMGDVLSLIESATDNIDEEDAKRWSKNAFGNKLTLEDLRDQFRSIKKMGSMGKIMGMLPMGQAIKEKLNDADMDKEIKRKEAIINSMTPKERRNPKILNGSRRKRIALGSGSDVSDVNRLLKEFESMQKMMKMAKKGGMKNMLAGLMR